MKKEDFLASQVGVEFAAQVVSVINIDNFDKILDALNDAGKKYNDPSTTWVFRGKAFLKRLKELQELQNALECQRQNSTINGEKVFYLLYDFFIKGDFEDKSFNTIFLREICRALIDEDFTANEEQDLIIKLVSSSKMFLATFSCHGKSNFVRTVDINQAVVGENASFVSTEKSLVFSQNVIAANCISSGVVQSVSVKVPVMRPKISSPVGDDMADNKVIFAQHNEVTPANKGIVMLFCNTKNLYDITDAVKRGITAFANDSLGNNSRANNSDYNSFHDHHI